MNQNFLSMKIIYNTWFPFGSFTTINLFGVLFTKLKKLTEVTLNHELIHTEQIKDCLYIFYYPFYVLEFCIKFLMTFNWKRAYHSISFEQESKENQFNLSYLEIRKRYNWFNKVFTLKPIIKK